MGVLDSVLQYKARKEAEEAQAAQAIPQAVQAFITGRQEAKKNMLDMLQIDATLATKGLKRTDQGIIRDESLADPMDAYIKQGNVAQSYNQQLTAGMLPVGSQPPSVGGKSSGMIGSGGQLNLPQAQAQTQQPSNHQDQDWFATQSTLNVAGQPTSTTVKSESGIRKELSTKREETRQTKLGEAEAKTQVAASEQSKSGYRFVQQYERSFDEIQNKIPGFSDSGIKGKAKRSGASVLNMLDELPETSVLVDSAEVFANRMVKADEGGKITDKDRAVYAKILVNTLAAPSTKNARLASNELVSLADRGADITENVIAFSQSKNPTLKKIYDQTVEAHPDLKVSKFVDDQTGEVTFMTEREFKKLGGAK